MRMKCGDEVAYYELIKDGGMVYIRYICEEGHKTQWYLIGEAPYPDEIEMEGSQ